MDLRAETSSAGVLLAHTRVAAVNNCSVAISGFATSAMYSRESNFFPVDVPDMYRIVPKISRSNHGPVELARDRPRDPRIRVRVAPIQLVRVV